MSEDGEADLAQDGNFLNSQKKARRENSEMKDLKEMKMKKEILFRKCLLPSLINQTLWRQLSEKSRK